MAIPQLHVEFFKTNSEDPNSITFINSFSMTWYIHSFMHVDDGLNLIEK